MELPVLFQAEQFALAAACGVMLSVWYDILWAVRRLFPRLTIPADLLFAIQFFFSLLLMALYIGRGVFRLFFLPAIICGVLLYFWLLSRTMRGFWLTIFRLFGRVFRRVWSTIAHGIKNFLKIIKKLFATGKKWGTITFKMAAQKKNAGRK